MVRFNTLNITHTHLFIIMFVNNCDLFLGAMKILLIKRTIRILTISTIREMIQHKETHTINIRQHHKCNLSTIRTTTLKHPKWIVIPKIKLPITIITNRNQLLRYPLPKTNPQDTQLVGLQYNLRLVKDNCAEAHPLISTTFIQSEAVMPSVRLTLLEGSVILLPSEMPCKETILVYISLLFLLRLTYRQQNH